MSRKIKHQQYEVLYNFKSNNCLSISAQFLPTGEHFINDSVQLMRINKQTVTASLQRKSQKNLRCEFEQIVEDGKKQLIIVFIVNFDFLPEFKEEVRLEYVEQKESLKGLNLINMQAEITEMEKALDSMSQNGTNTIHTETTVNFPSNDKKQVWSSQVKQGKYIIRCSGTINNHSGLQSNDKVLFYMCPPNEDKEVKPIQIKTYHQSGYHYPFFVSELVDCKQGTLRVKMGSSVLNASAMNVHVVMNRVVEVN